MTTTKQPHRSPTGKLSMAEILEVFAATGRHPLKFTAYDGSTAGSEDAALGLDLRTPRGATYMATAPGELGLARAYVSGDLQAYGVHPGDPYQLLKTLTDRVEFKRPPARVLANVVRSMGFERMLPVSPPPQETLPRWRRVAENVAMGYGSPKAVMQAWMASPGHRANILDCRLRHLGVGVVLQGDQVWWTQDFARR